MNLNESDTVFTNLTVRAEVEAFSHRWDGYFYSPCKAKLWPGLVTAYSVSELFRNAGKMILINVLPAVFALEILIYAEEMSWTFLLIVALLTLEIGPYRLLTRLVDRVAPYPEESGAELPQREKTNLSEL